MSAPNLYTADDLQNWPCKLGLEDGRWVLARPIGYSGIGCLVYRICLAWNVFTGRYDAVRWIEQP